MNDGPGLVLARSCADRTCTLDWSPRQAAVRRLRIYSLLRNLLYASSFSIPFLTGFISAYAFFCAQNHVARIVEIAPLLECVLIGLCLAFTCVGLAMVSTPEIIRRKSHRDVRIALRKIAPRLTADKRF
ncbi:MAG TPA: hypothetical protein V6C72_16730 [Chroococcales cyanobacterium]